MNQKKEDVFKQKKLYKGGISMKKTIKLIGVIITIFVILQTNVKAFTINTAIRANIVYDDVMPYHYEGEEKVNYKMLTYRDTNLYTLNRNNDVVMTLFTTADKYQEEVCEKILENGYPIKTYEELGLSNKKEAYFATQEAIYAYLEKKDISKYIAETEEGERILGATKRILNKAKSEEVAMNEIDKDWQEEETQPDRMYKRYRILLDSKIESVTINLENGFDTKICTQENNDISTVKNGDIIKIMIPKGMNQKFQAKLSYKKNGVNLYKCYHSSNTSIKYLISETAQLQKEKVINISYQGLAPITITNYDYETKGKIEGSVFEILDDWYESITGNLSTNSEGVIQTFLEKGNYFLKQIQVKDGYSLSQNLISFTVKGIEDINLNMYNAKETQEEINQEKTQINMTQENKKIIDNEITNITNIHNTNIETEKTYQTNEINLENINYFTNINYRKNIQNIVKENTYQNKNWREIVTNENMDGVNEETYMTRDDYMTYIDFIKIGSFEVPNLPVALRQ